MTCRHALFSHPHSPAFPPAFPRPSSRGALPPPPEPPSSDPTPLPSPPCPTRTAPSPCRTAKSAPWGRPGSLPGRVHASAPAPARPAEWGHICTPRGRREGPLQLGCSGCDGACGICGSGGACGLSPALSTARSQQARVDAHDGSCCNALMTERSSLGVRRMPTAREPASGWAMTNHSGFWPCRFGHQLAGWVLNVNHHSHCSGLQARCQP